MECKVSDLKVKYGIDNKFITYGLGKYSKMKFNPIVNRNFVKPYGGLWSSSVNSIWGWKDWCISEGFHTERLNENFEFTLKDNAKIYVINDFSDLNNLIKDNMIFDYLQLLDFEKISNRYDAILLTYKGQVETRYSDPGLYGWDCESLLVMNSDCICNIL